MRTEPTFTVTPSFLDPRGFGLFKAAYSVKETLNLLSIGRTKFYELVDLGELKIIKLGKQELGLRNRHRRAAFEASGRIGRGLIDDHQA